MKKDYSCLIAACSTISIYAALSSCANGSIGIESADYFTPRCETPDGWEEVESLQPQYVVFGELHGTREAPKFVENLVCALSQSGERVLLAVEHDAIHDQAFQEAWQRSDDQFEELLIQAGWKDRVDGVASEAMLSLLKRVHRLKSTGRPISIVPFNGFRNPEQEARYGKLEGQNAFEAAEAENIASLVSGGSFDIVLVLAGNLHARKNVIDFGGLQIEPLARRLSRSGITVSLNMRYSDGTTWSCILRPDFDPRLGKPASDDDVECGIHSTRGNADYARQPFIELTKSSGDKMSTSYDGFFWVGTISGSAPVLRTKASSD